jgi:hypothetical protein
MLPPALVLLLCVRNYAGAEGAAERDLPTPVISMMRERAVVLRMVTRVLEKDDSEAWFSDSSKVTIPGRPVGIKIVGENVALSVQFTPYPGRNGKGVLVAQGQIWVETSGGLQYRTMMQTVPLEYGEQVFFFPLGAGGPEDEARIEIQIDMRRYAETPVGESPIGEPPIGEPPVAEPPAAEPPVGEPPIADPPVGEPLPNEPKDNEPRQEDGAD